jgi:hypothetical protein
MQVQANVLGLEFFDEVDQVLKAAANAVNSPCGHHINLAVRGVLAHAVKRWPLIATLCAADTVVHILLHHVPTALLGNAHKVLALVLDSLIRGANPKVDCDPLCFGHVAAPLNVWDPQSTEAIPKSSPLVCPNTARVTD